jgi:hypothetical protein
MGVRVRYFASGGATSTQQSQRSRRFAYCFLARRGGRLRFLKPPAAARSSPGREASFRLGRAKCKQICQWALGAGGYGPVGGSGSRVVLSLPGNGWGLLPLVWKAGAPGLRVPASLRPGMPAQAVLIPAAR